MTIYLILSFKGDTMTTQLTQEYLDRLTATEYLLIKMKERLELIKALNKRLEQLNKELA